MYILCKEKLTSIDHRAVSHLNVVCRSLNDWCAEYFFPKKKLRVYRYEFKTIAIALRSNEFIIYAKNCLWKTRIMYVNSQVCRIELFESFGFGIVTIDRPTNLPIEI